MPLRGRRYENEPIPRAAVRAQPLQRLEVATLRSTPARILVPRAAVLVNPLQHLEVPALRRVRARRQSHGHPFVRAHSAPGGTRPLPHPCAASLARPLHYLEVPRGTHRRRPTRRLVPRCVVRAKILQLFEMSTPRLCLTKVYSMRQATSPFQALARA